MHAARFAHDVGVARIEQPGVGRRCGFDVDCVEAQIGRKAKRAPQRIEVCLTLERRVHVRRAAAGGVGARWRRLGAVGRAGVGVERVVVGAVGLVAVVEIDAVGHVGQYVVDGVVVVGAIKLFVVE